MKNREKYLEYQRDYRQKNKDKLKVYFKNRWINNKDELKKKFQIYRKRNLTKIKILKHQEYLKNKQSYLDRANKYYQIHKEEIKIKYRKYFNLNKKRILDKIYKRVKNRRKKDINFKLLCNLRTRLNDALKNNSKSQSTIQLLGCSVEFLKQHLQKQFTKGMSWKNRSKWHIDHIRPCASFDLSKAMEQRKCFNYKNLQPLWAEENRLKRNNFIGRVI